MANATKVAKSNETNNVAQKALSHFGAANPIISNMVERCLKITPIDPKSFRLSVETPNDNAEPIQGQYNVEASVCLQLRNTAFSEIVSAANKETRRDSKTPVADRGRNASGYEDTYDGAEEPEITEYDLTDNLQEALDRATAICRYMSHIAEIKKGGAEWLKGFNVPTWVAIDPKDEEAKLACELKGADLTKFITESRIKKGTKVVDNRLISFNEWIDEQLKSTKISADWRNCLAYAKVQKLDVDWSHIPVNDAMNYMGAIAQGSAFGRTNTRLHDAIVRVANSKYINLVYTINNAVLDEDKIKALKELEKSAVTFLVLPYSDMMQKDIKEVKASDEWLDAEEQKEIEEAQKLAQQSRREALRMQNAMIRQQMGLDVMKMNAETNKLKLALAAQQAKMDKEMQELLNPKPAAKKPAAKKPAAKKPAAKKPAAKKASTKK